MCNDQEKLPFLAVDITNQCNNRCRFCFNDWGAPYNMDFDVWKKIVDNAPRFVEDRIFINCLYEPTLHPEFMRFLQYIPRDIGHKFFFTTNLASNLSDSFFRDLAKLNLSHINISLETLREDRYAYLMRNKKSRFFENLKKLVKCFKESESPPPYAL